MNAWWEVKIIVYRKGRRVKISNAMGDTPTEALYNAHNDLELWAQDHPDSQPTENGENRG